jgi:hypothetical protein
MQFVLPMSPVKYVTYLSDSTRRTLRMSVRHFTFSVRYCKVLFGIWNFPSGIPELSVRQL